MIHRHVECRGLWVDELIAPLLKKIWDMDMETLYSCQGGEDDDDFSGYITFVKYKDSKKFMEVLVKNKIKYELCVIKDENERTYMSYEDFLLIILLEL